MTQTEIIKAHYAKIGRKGGQSKSKAAVAAARKNGKKGGRPRITAPPPTRQV